jgi:hypothetical protein
MQFMNRFKAQPSAEAQQIVENLAAGRDADETPVVVERKTVDATSAAASSRHQQPPPAPTSSFSTFLARRTSSLVRLSTDLQQSLAHREQVRQWEETDPDLLKTFARMERVRQDIRDQQQTNRTQSTEYHKELQDMKASKQAIGRDLWLKQQNHKLNPLLVKEYYEYLLEQDQTVEDLTKDEQKQLVAQAKLLKAQHNDNMTDRQMQMVRDFQQDLIDFLYSGMLPSLKNEAQQVAVQGNEQIEQFQKQTEELNEMYTKLTELQERILEAYRSKLTPQQKLEMEQEKAAEEEAARSELQEREEESEQESTESEPVDAPPPPATSSSLPTLAAMSPFSSRKNTAVTSGSNHSKESKTLTISSSDESATRDSKPSSTVEKNVDNDDDSEHPNDPAGASATPTSTTPMTLQERIAARAAERKAAGVTATSPTPKVSTTAATANSKTSRSDLLERARKAREKSETAVANSPVKTGGRPSVRNVANDDDATLQQPLSTSSASSVHSSSGSVRSSGRSLSNGSNHSAKESVSSKNSNSSSRSGKSSGQGTAATGVITAAAAAAKEEFTTASTSTSRPSVRVIGKTGATGAGNAHRPSTLGVRRTAGAATTITARRPTATTGLSTALSEERRAQIREGLRKGNGSKQ